MGPEESGKAELQLTPFDSEGAPPITFTLMEPTADTPGLDGRPIDVHLQRGTLYVDVRLQRVRPRTTYTSTLTLVFRGKKHEWDISLKVGDLGARTWTGWPPAARHAGSVRLGQRAAVPDHPARLLRARAVQPGPGARRGS
jgi:hypothetical protein